MPPFGKIEPKFGDDDNDEETPIAINHEEQQPTKKPGEGIDLDAFAAATSPRVEPTPEIETNSEEDDIASFDTIEEPRAKTRINKKRAFGLLFFVAILVSAVVFAGDLYNLTSETVKEKIDEVEDIAKLNTPPPTNYIDDGEQQNSFLKENSEAKQANVSVFDFDINNCLQQYSDEQCTDMYEKHLLISEKK